MAQGNRRSRKEFRSQGAIADILGSGFKAVLSSRVSPGIPPNPRQYLAARGGRASPNSHYPRAFHLAFWPAPLGGSEGASFQPTGHPKCADASPPVRRTMGTRSRIRCTDIRSAGPETLTAATVSPRAFRTGTAMQLAPSSHSSKSRATPCSRTFASSTRSCAHRRHPGGSRVRDDDGPARCQ